MKRFYSLFALLMMVVMTATAQNVKSVADVQPVKGTLTRVGDVQKQVKVDFTKVKMQPNVQGVELVANNGSKKAPAKVEGTWTSLGTATYTEDCLTTFFNIGDVTVEAEIEESVETPGLYRMENPYYAVKAAIGGAVLSSADEYWYIHAEDPTKVWTEVFNTGFRPSTEYGNMVIYSYAGYLLNYGQTPDDALYGSLNDGVITFPESTLFVNWQNGTKYSSSSLYYANLDGKFKISLPGAKDYSCSVSVPTCAEGNVIPVDVVLGADVTNAAVVFAPGDFPADPEVLALVPHMGIPVTESGSFEFDFDGEDAGKYTVLIATYTDEGEILDGTRTYFYVIEDDAENWKSLGMTMYGEDFIGSVFNADPSDFLVEIQENVNTQRFYRLVNPYSENFPYNDYNDHEADHNHYMYIHAENPDMVWIEDSPIGQDWGYGGMSVASIAKNLDESEYGTFVDGRITFPANSLVMAMQTYQHAAWLTANQNECFYVDVPEIAYTANGVVGNGVIEKGMPFFNTPVKVESWTNNTIFVRAWDGVEGSDLKITYAGTALGDEALTLITNIEQFVDGEVVSEYVEDDDDPDMNYVALQPQSAEYPAAMIYVGSEMTGIMLGEGEEAGMGNLSLYGVWMKAPEASDDDDIDAGFGYTEPETIEAAYIVSWPGKPMEIPLTLGELKTLGDYSENVLVGLDNTCVTFYTWDEDYGYGYAVLEDETGAVLLQFYEPLEGFAQGKTVSGRLYMDEVYGLIATAVVSAESVAGLVFGEDADVTTGVVIKSVDEFNDPDNLFRLVTVFNTVDTPITTDYNMPTIGEGDEHGVADAFEILDYDFMYPETFKSVTGILWVEDGYTFVCPRSAADIVEGAMANVSLETKGFATYFNSVENMKMPEEVKAYTYSVDGETLTCTEVKGNIVPAGVAVVLYSETPDTYTLTGDYTNMEAAAEALNATNNLKGTDNETTITADADSKLYKLSTGDKGIGFYMASEDGKTLVNGAHKAYLEVPATANVKFFALDGTATAIDAVESAEGKGEIFTISGVKVEKASQKGLYIINGKKYIVK